MNAFYLFGGLLAVWAVLLALLGIARHSFPGSRGGERVVIAISVILVACAIGSAIITGALEEGEDAEAGAPSESSAPAEPAPSADAAQAAGQQLQLSADPSGQLAFDVTELEAKPGEATLVMENPATLEHNVALEGDAVDEQGETVPKGGTSMVSAELKPGEYTFYCSVPGHREGGMEGTLAVR